MGPNAEEPRPALTRLLGDKDSGVRQLAAMALVCDWSTSTPAVKEITGSCRDDRVPGVREAAADALSEIGPDKSAVPGLTKMLSEEDSLNSPLRHMSWEKLAGKQAAAVPALTELSHDSDRYVHEVVLGQ